MNYKYGKKRWDLDSLLRKWKRKGKENYKRGQKDGELEYYQQGGYIILKENYKNEQNVVHSRDIIS